MKRSGDQVTLPIGGVAAVFAKLVHPECKALEENLCMRLGPWLVVSAAVSLRDRVWSY